MIPHDFYFSRGIELTKQRSIPASSIPLNFLMSSPGYEGVTFTQWIQVGYITVNFRGQRPAWRQTEWGCLNHSAPTIVGWTYMFLIIQQSLTKKREKFPTGERPLFWGHIARWQLDVFAARLQRPGERAWTSYQWNPTMWEGIHPGYTGEFPIKSRSLIRSVHFFPSQSSQDIGIGVGDFVHFISTHTP